MLSRLLQLSRRIQTLNLLGHFSLQRVQRPTAAKAVSGEYVKSLTETKKGSLSTDASLELYVNQHRDEHSSMSISSGKSFGPECSRAFVLLRFCFISSF